MGRIFVQVKFDNCSSDCWIIHALAQRLKAKVLDDWSGMVKTINGIEKKTLKRYQVKVKKNNGDFTKLICFGTDSIGYKPKIETIRLNRLCKAFNIAVTRIDNQEGQIGLLISLKCQSLQ